MLAFFALLVVLYFCFYCLKPLRRRLSASLFWNVLIRLFMEVYLETILLSIHNLKNIVWKDSSLHIASNILAIVFVLVFCLVPLFLLYFFGKFKEIWHTDKFRDKYGTLIESSNQNSEADHKWAHLIAPMIFFKRRLVLALSIVLLGDYLWLQIFLSFLSAVGNAVFLLHAKPYTTKWTNQIEVFNDCTFICICYSLICFSYFVPLAEGRYNAGFGFIGLALLNLTIHLILLFFNFGQKTKLTILRCCNKMKIKRR